MTDQDDFDPMKHLFYRKTAEEIVANQRATSDRHPADRHWLAREFVRDAMGKAVAAGDEALVDALHDLLQHMPGDALGYDTTDFMQYAHQVADDALAGRHEDAVREELVRLSNLFPGPKYEDKE
jgi:predicted GNAT family N-acyltransferase